MGIGSEIAAFLGVGDEDQAPINEAAAMRSMAANRSTMQQYQAYRDPELLKDLAVSRTINEMPNADDATQMARVKEIYSELQATLPAGLDVAQRSGAGAVVPEMSGQPAEQSGPGAGYKILNALTAPGRGVEAVLAGAENRASELTQNAPMERMGAFTRFASKIPTTLSPVGYFMPSLAGTLASMGSGGQMHGIPMQALAQQGPGALLDVVGSGLSAGKREVLEGNYANTPAITRLESVGERYKDMAVDQVLAEMPNADMAAQSARVKEIYAALLENEVSPGQVEHPTLSGIATNLIGDPTMYIPGGAIGKAAKLAGKGVKAGSWAERGLKVAGGAALGGTLASLTGDVGGLAGAAVGAGLRSSVGERTVGKGLKKAFTYLPHYKELGEKGQEETASMLRAAHERSLQTGKDMYAEARKAGFDIADQNIRRQITDLELGHINRILDDKGLVKTVDLKNTVVPEEWVDEVLGKKSAVTGDEVAKFVHDAPGSASADELADIRRGSGSGLDLHEPEYPKPQHGPISPAMAQSVEKAPVEELGLLLDEARRTHKPTKAVGQLSDDEIIQQWGGKGGRVNEQGIVKSATEHVPIKVSQLSPQGKQWYADKLAKLLSEKQGVEIVSLAGSPLEKSFKATRGAEKGNLVMLPKTVKEHMEFLAKPGGEYHKLVQGWNDFSTKFYRPAQAFWGKMKTTIGGPAFANRNLLSGAGLSLLGLGIKGLNPLSQVQAFKLACRAAQDDLPKAVKAMAKMTFKLNRGQHVKGDQLFEIMRAHGLTGQLESRLNIDDLRRLSPKGNFENVVGRAYQGLPGAAEKVLNIGGPLSPAYMARASENYQHMVTFIGFLDDTSEPSIARALDLSSKYSGNYNRLTTFEKTAMRDVFGFYAWSRFAAPLLFQQIKENPARLASFLKLRSMAAQALPQDKYGWAGKAAWLRENSVPAPEALQPGKDDDAGHQFGLLTIEDPIAVSISALKGFMGQSYGEASQDDPLGEQMGPLVKGVVEFLTGKDIRTGNPIPGGYSGAAFKQAKDTFQRPSKALTDMYDFLTANGKESDAVSMMLRYQVIRMMTGLPVYMSKPYEETARTSAKALKPVRQLLPEAGKALE